MLLSRQELYSIVGAVGVIGFGWVVQLYGLPWEVIVLALGILGWGFAPRVMRSVKSWRGSKPVQAFQTFTGGDELLKDLEWIESRCGQLRGNISASMQDRQTVTRELYHLSISLQTVRGRHLGIWDSSLLNKVTIVDNQLMDAGSALGGAHYEDAKAHIDAAVQNAKSIIAELKAPPSS